MHNTEEIYTYRYVAQIVIEAVTPLKTGSGKSDIFIDAPVLKDWNGLPMILGSSIAGVLRHSFDESIQKEIFGYGEYRDSDGMGSRLLVSNAHLLDAELKVHQGLGISKDDKFLSQYNSLPVREHTAINAQGSAKAQSKFDEEVVYAGSRFKCDLEFIGDENDEEKWEAILETLNSPLFRLGAGSTKGFGEMKIVSCLKSTYILGQDYGEKPSDLNTPLKDTNEKKNTLSQKLSPYYTYTLRLEPESFFSFGAGFGDDDVDDISVTEQVVEWKEDKGSFTEQKILLPATSLKGALSHRVAFHYNRLNKVFSDKIDVNDFDKYTGENNEAVAMIFGASKGHVNEQKGKALFSDMYKTFDTNQMKIFDHVKIDRFTGGASDSALFDEKVMAQKDIWDIHIILSDEIGGKIKEAFESTLDDLVKGWLPLGGKVNRGHGVFVCPKEDFKKEPRGWRSKVIGGKNA